MVRLPVLDTLVEVTLPRDALCRRLAAQYIVSAPSVKERLGGKTAVRRPQAWADKVASSTAAAAPDRAAWAAQVDRKIDALRGFWRESRAARPAWLDDAMLMTALLDGRAPDGTSAFYASFTDAEEIARLAVAAIVGHRLRECAPGRCEACDLATHGDWTGALGARAISSDPVWDLLTALQRTHVVKRFQESAPTPSTSVYPAWMAPDSDDQPF